VLTDCRACRQHHARGLEVDRLPMVALKYRVPLALSKVCEVSPT